MKVKKNENNIEEKNDNLGGKAMDKNIGLGEDIMEMEEISAKLDKANAELNMVNDEVNSIDDRRLNYAIKIALKGLKFDKIIQTKTEYNDSFYDSEYTYFIDEENKYLKGILLYKDKYFSQEDIFGEKSKTREIYLLSNGKIQVFIEDGDYSNMQKGTSYYSKAIDKDNYLGDYTIDDLISEIGYELKIRLKEVGEKTKLQMQRLGKLRKVKI